MALSALGKKKERKSEKVGKGLAQAERLHSGLGDW